MLARGRRIAPFSPPALADTAFGPALAASRRFNSNASLLNDGAYARDDASAYRTGDSAYSRPLYSASTVFAAFVVGILSATALGAVVLSVLDTCGGDSD